MPLGTPGRTWGAVGLLTVIAALLRLKGFDASMLGDELSTVWIVEHNSFGQMISLISSDAEITPPFYFVLAWLSMKLGGAPELVRLPAMLAGVGMIPLVYAVGIRTIGRLGALIAAAVATISPFLIFHSFTGRAYMLGMFLVLLSTLALLLAIQDGRRRWWVLYGASVCLAMYSHYTMVFLLAGQFGWLLWVRRDLWRPLLIATGAAALLFAPWVPSAIADSHAITIPIVEAIQGDGIRAKFDGVTQVTLFQPLIWNWNLSGRLDVWLISIGALLAFAGAIWRLARRRVPAAAPGTVEGGLALVVVLTLATGVGEALLLVGTDIFGGRNLAGTWVGLPLLLGAALSLSSVAVALVSGVLLFAGFGIGAERTTNPATTAIPYKDAADYVERTVGEGVVVDAGHLTPAPYTSFEAYLPESIPRYEPLVSPDRPDFIKDIFFKEDPQKAVDRAFATAGPVEVVTVAQGGPVTEDGFVVQLDSANPVSVPPGWKITKQVTFDGVQDLVVTTFERRGSGGD